MSIFVISAPSGTGKTTIVEKLLKEGESLRIRRVITATTRAKRESEIEGVDYIFMDVESFKEGIKKNEFLEYANVYGNYYGTPKSQVLKNEEENFSSILVIDVQGAKKIKEVRPDSLLIFILPPSLQELERRLLSRGFLDKNLQERLRSVKEEIACAKYFDYIILNDYIDNAVKVLKSIIISHMHKTETFTKNLDFVIKDEEMRRLIKGDCKIFHGGKV